MSRIFSVRYDVVTTNLEDKDSGVEVDRYDGKAIVVDLNSGDATVVQVHEDEDHNRSFDDVTNVVAGLDGDGLLNRAQLDIYLAVRGYVQERSVDPGPFVITISDEGLVLLTRLTGEAQDVRQSDMDRSRRSPHDVGTLSRADVARLTKK
jgi:hypothetical protein